MLKDTITHFGLEVQPRKRGYFLNKENYVSMNNRRSLGKDEVYKRALEANNIEILAYYEGIYADSEGLIYTEDTCNRFLHEAMENFDLNMAFFSKLDRKKFNAEIDLFVKKTKFKNVYDLNSCCCAGYYVMILDGYCQLYVGTSKNIKDRIRQHWNGGKLRLDRLVCGSVNTSKLSIDSFRCLDTTRLLVYRTQNIYSTEDDYIGYFSDDYLCNRVKGGLFLGDNPFSIDSADRYKYRSFE